MNFHRYKVGETQINVPVSVGDECLGKIEHLLVTYVGGFTLTRGNGAWRAEREPVIIYHCAGLPFPVVELCAQYVIDAGQTDVYIRLPDGSSAWFDNRGESEERPLAEWGDVMPSAEHVRIEKLNAENDRLYHAIKHDVETERTRERLSDIYA